LDVNKLQSAILPDLARQLASNRMVAVSGISCLASILASGKAHSSGIIFQSGTGFVREDWIRDWDFTKGIRALVTSTESGWINADLALQYLEYVIDKETRCSGGGYRLLLLDGYSTHLQLPILDYCDKAKIIIGLLPAHSTHIMQPLDIGCFGPLSQAYSKALEKMQSSLLLASGVTQADFWRVFEHSWKDSFTEKNIISSFKATGLYPFSPKKVLNKIPERPKDQTETNPCYKIRQLRQKAKQDPKWQDPMIQDFLNCFEHMAIELECTKHDVAQLKETIKRERKKIPNSKQILHPDLPNLGKGMFLTPGKIQKARQWDKEKTDKAEADAAAKAAQKFQRELNAAHKKAEQERKTAEAAERKAIASQIREEKAQEKAKREEERLARLAAAKQLKEERKLVRRRSKMPARLPKRVTRDSQQASKAACQALKDEEEEWVDIDEVLIVIKKGRAVRKPSRFRR
jgi:hypothetical protein